MIPDLIHNADNPFMVLPAGIHDAAIDEIQTRFAINGKRRELLTGFLLAANNLHAAGCHQIFLDGSYVTDKPIPGDYDAIWDASFVDFNLLDPLFMDVQDLQSGRHKQKGKYGGEFFELGMRGSAHLGILDFFQLDRHNGSGKGIIRVNLTSDPYFKRGE